MTGTARKAKTAESRQSDQPTGDRGRQTALYMSKSSAPLAPPNHRNRWTRYLYADKAFDLIESVKHASVIGCPLNLFATVHFERAGLSPLVRPQEAIGGLTRRAGQWLRLRGVPLTYAWVMEEVQGTGRHVHLMVHCPPALQTVFKLRAKRDWLKQSGMEPRDRHAIDIQRIGPRGYDHATASDQLHDTYQRQIQGLLRYHLKGHDPDELVTLGSVTKPLSDWLIPLVGARVEPEDQAAIYGRRVSRSQNIGQLARDRYHADRASDSARQGEPEPPAARKCA